MPKVSRVWGVVSYERLKGSGDMRKTSIGMIMDRQPCTNAEAQTFCGNAWNARVDAPGGIKRNITEDRDEIRENNATQ